MHYIDEDVKKLVENIIKEKGFYLRVTSSKGITYSVPRHYLALHGIKEEELPSLEFEVIH